MNETKRPAAREDLPADLPFCEDISPLAAPLTVSGKTVPNRICYQPMEGCDGTSAGAPDELTCRRYLRFAHGGAGLIWFEATAIVPEGRANPRQLYLSPETRDGFARLIAKIKETCLRENGYEPIIVCQLTHSGRYAKPQGTPAPMITHHKPLFEKDRPLPEDCIVTDEYLDTLPERYAASARLCRAVGFDGVDIKACHGYLLSELLNSFTRAGRFGGSYENRTRLFFDAARAARAELADGDILCSRYNAYDGYPHPYGIGDSGTPGVPDFGEAARIAADLGALGMSLLNITMGNPYTNPEVNRPTAAAKEEMPWRSIARMRRGAEEVNRATPDAVSVICSAPSFMGAMAPHVAAADIAAGRYAMIGFGRQTFSYPDLARDILGGGMQRDRLCLTCGKCTQIMRAGMTPGCPIYDREVYLPLYRKTLS